MAEILLALVPLLALLASLLLGHYPGLGAIVKLAEKIAASVGLRGPRKQARPQVPRSRAASGGLLIACSLAQRPPPVIP
jgi:hypothetical protein